MIMPVVGKAMRSVIENHVIMFLKSGRNKPQFTSMIAQGIARDEEFAKSFLQAMRSRKLLILIDKNKKGKKWKSRQMWRLSSKGLK